MPRLGVSRTQVRDDDGCMDNNFHMRVTPKRPPEPSRGPVLAAMDRIAEECQRAANATLRAMNEATALKMSRKL